jgi:F-type H+-transporting ATPase subunit b
MHLDNTFFAFVALVIFLGIVFYVGAHKKIAVALDDRGAKIAKDLDDARKLREEAQALLDEYKRKRGDAELEAKSIIEQAKREAESLAVETRVKLTDMLARRTKQAEQKISQAEAAAVKEVRALTTDAAIKAAGKLMGEVTSGPKGAKLIADSITAVKSRLN